MVREDREDGTTSTEESVRRNSENLLPHGVLREDGRVKCLGSHWNTWKFIYSLEYLNKESILERL